MTRNRSAILFCLLILIGYSISCKPKSHEENIPALPVEKQTTPAKNTAGENNQPGDTNNIIKVSALSLTSAYVANEVKADYDYKNKQVIVTGTVADIKKGVAGDIYIILQGIEKSRAVQCYYADEKDAQTLQKGMSVSFKGNCDGLWVNVIMSDCERILKKQK